MRYILILIGLFFGLTLKAQFTGTDSLRNYNNRYITNNPATAFTNLRLHTLLRGMIDWIDTARAGTGGGGAVGVDTLWALNDSTVRYRRNGVFKNFVLKGVYDTRRKVDTVYKVNDTTIGFTINHLTRTINIPGRYYVDSIYRKGGQDSIYYRKSGTEYAILDSMGAAQLTDSSFKVGGDTITIRGTGIFVDGIHKDSDTVRLGDTILSKYHNVIHYVNQKSSEPPTGTGSLFLTNNIDSLNTEFLIQLASDTAISTHDGLTTNNYDRAMLNVARFYGDEDSLYKLWGGAIQTRTKQVYDPDRKSFAVSSNYGIALPYSGYSGQMELSPPDTAYWKISPYGMVPTIVSGAMDIGGDNKYRLTIVGSQSGYPVPLSKMTIDYAKKSQTEKREMYGHGIAGYLWDWKSYQGSLTSGTTEYGHNINKTYGFHAYGALKTFTSAGSKTKVLAVSKVDTAIAFYAAPMWADFNEVNNGYGFVADGAKDWNFFKGKLRVGGAMQSQADTQTHQVHIDSTLRIGATPFFNAYHTEYWRQHNVNNSNFSSARKQGVFVDFDMRFHDNVPQVYNASTNGLVVHTSIYGDSIIEANNTGNTVSGTNGVVSRLHLHKNPGYSDTTTIIGGTVATNGPSAINATIDVSGESGSGKPTIGSGWFSALTTSYQMSGANNKLGNAIWLSVGARQAGSANTITNGYGIYFNAFGSDVTNKYAMYQAGTSDTTYLAGKLRLPNLVQQADTNTYKPVVTDASGNIFKMSGWPVTAAAGVTDHGALTGLGDDDHTQYALLAGRSGGQTLIGGTGTTDDLNIQSTSGVGAAGADIVFKVGNNGATEALKINNDASITNTAYNNTLYKLRLGDFVLQPFALNNGFIANNAYHNGSSWTRLVTGYASGFQFFNGQLIVNGANTGTGNFTPAVPLKADFNGNVALGGTAISTTLGAFTGATMLVSPTAVTSNADLTVPDEAYNSTNWDGNLEVPTKNAIRDKIESMGGGAQGIDDVLATDNVITTNRSIEVGINNLNITGNTGTDVFSFGPSETYGYQQHTFGHEVYFETAGGALDTHVPTVTTQTTYKPLIDNSTGQVLKAVEPKVYTALLSQSGTSDPTVVILGTNTIGTIVWTRNSTGNYTGTLTGAFTANKTWAIAQKGDMSGSAINSILSKASGDALTLTVTDNAGNATDGITELSIEVRVYP